MIKRSFVRLLGAGCLGLFSLSFLSGDPSDGVGIGLLVVAGIWGFVELFILTGLLFMYGITGLLHDVGAAQDRDPWNRW